MAKASIVAGATSQSVNIFIQDSSSTVGAGLSGLVYNSTGLTAYFTFTGANATATAITLATLAAVNSSWSTGGFKEIDATHMKGVYRLDIPNAALAAASGQLSTIYLYGAANMAPCVLEIELTAVNNQSTGFGLVDASANVVQIAGSAVSTSTAQLGVNVVNIAGTASAGTAGYVGADWGAITNKTSTNALTATTISTAQTITSVSGAVGSVTGAVGSVTGAVGSVTGAVGSVTGNVGGSVVGSVASVTAAVAVTSNIKKNSASRLTFTMTDSTTHNPKTGLTVAGQVSIDGGAFSNLTNTPASEIASGDYTIALAAADTNGNTLMFRFTAAASDDLNIMAITQP